MPGHGGVKRTPNFERSEFCKDCHQFDPEDTVLVNGKPLQDTYREWKSSLWSEGGASCQECHMPNRRHLWKGIHDPEWVKSSVQVEVKMKQAQSVTRHSVELLVEITNASVGHKFPTYVTPKVFVRAALLDQHEGTLPGTQQEIIIGWDARHEGGKWVEHFDTRVPPGKKFSQTFRWNPLPSGAMTARVWVEVHPDHFYRVYFYPAYLKQKGLSAAGRRLIEKALQESERTPYNLFETKVRLAGEVGELSPH
jgi:hypothetical protein